MKRTALRAVFLSSALVLICVGFLYAAEYRSSYREKKSDYDGGGSEQSFDPSQFRKGNPEWDTQEQIASGFKTLHEENMKILKELKELKAAVERREGSN